MKAAILFVAVGFAACSTGPVSVTCTDLGFAPVTNFDQRIRLPGFSVLPPTGSHWCVKESNSVVVFGKNLYGARTLQSIPSQEELAHTFVATAFVAEVDGPRPSNGAALQAFIEQWLHNGGLSNVQSGKWKISNRPRTDSGSSRFTVVRSEVVGDISLGATCVRYSVIVEERDNPGAQGDILVLEEPENYACLHPSSADELIMIGYSERYIKDRRPGPSLIQTLRPELESFLRDIRFDAAE